MTVPTAFLDAIDGGLWVKVDQHRHRVYVWKGGGAVGVFSIVDGADLGTWLCGEPTAESAALCAAEMTRAGH